MIQIKAAADDLRDPGSCMIQVIDQLERDHRNMPLLLDIVEAEMAGYRAGHSPDFELLQMIAAGRSLPSAARAHSAAAPLRRASPPVPA
jgi:hypothetical protein